MASTLVACSNAAIHDMVETYHGYKSAGRSSTYAFAVYEQGAPVAVFSWQPPPVGSAKNVCPEAPHAVLALSRMVAVPKDKRELRHISKPLRQQMKLIDRGRWPVLITFSDEGQGHTGHVYQCSGWQKTVRNRHPFSIAADGSRVSTYSNGKKNGRDGMTLGGYTWLQRWEHWACPVGSVAAWMAQHGWCRIPVPNKTWASGNPAYTWVRK